MKKILLGFLLSLICFNTSMNAHPAGRFVEPAVKVAGLLTGLVGTAKILDILDSKKNEKQSSDSDVQKALAILKGPTVERSLQSGIAGAVASSLTKPRKK